MRAYITLFGLLVLTLALASYASQEAPYPATSGGETVQATTVTVSDRGELGQILTDDQARTVYIFLNDTPKTSTCYDNCGENWPPFSLPATPWSDRGWTLPRWALLNVSFVPLRGKAEVRDGTAHLRFTIADGVPLGYFGLPIVNLVVR